MADAAAAQDGGTGNWLFDALLKPGSASSPGMMAFLDKVFILLLLSIAFLIWHSGFTNIHPWIFLFLALGLMASVRYFVAELRKSLADGSFTFGEDPAKAVAETKKDE
mmetsp:Transcript_48290/g.110005  ORF Transcript_48290/g.110005 Transcript_48290/m.110005 type:complete len:108 (+) Transcript_48290:50-373(+)